MLSSAAFESSFSRDHNLIDGEIDPTSMLSTMPGAHLAVVLGAMCSGNCVLPSDVQAN